MPKLRAPVDSLRDAQKHMIVFKSRILKSERNGSNHDSDEIAVDVNRVIITIDALIDKLPQEEKSFPDKAVSSALDLINKEVKKNVPKIDYLGIVRDMCNASVISEAKRIGLEHNISDAQVNQVINRAPLNSNLGRAVAVYKAKLQRMKPKPAPIKYEPSAPNVIMEDDDNSITNDSDEGEMDDELNHLLASK
jgi:hypothetical protein